VFIVTKKKKSRVEYEMGDCDDRFDIFELYYLYQQQTPEEWKKTVEKLKAQGCPEYYCTFD
jgi:hypothetical protein